MEKRAATSIPILDLLERRWSPRAFADRSVEPETLRKLFEAARWSPSSSNSQPWNFIVARKEKPEEFARALECLRPGNATWAAKAPVLVFTVARRDWPERNEVNHCAQYDVGQAVAHLSVQATAEGLAVHQMAGIIHGKIKEVFSVPEGYDPLTAVAIGYPGDPDELPEDLRKRELGPRKRNPLEEFVFEGGWKSPAPFLKS